MRDFKISFILLFIHVGLLNHSKDATDRWLTVMLNFKYGVFKSLHIAYILPFSHLQSALHLFFFFFEVQDFPPVVFFSR